MDIQKSISLSEISSKKGQEDSQPIPQLHVKD